ncbi:MAG: hypothetical protein J6T51_05760 [Kiritimatiellae bacterium]|nr:hypothetical protein [Kiritimatiellia bacterium]
MSEDENEGAGPTGEDEAFVRSLREADPADLPPLPRAAPMTIGGIVEIPTRQARHVLVTLAGRDGPSWSVCVKKGLFKVGEKVLFVRKDVMIRDAPCVKEAAVTPYRRKKLFFRGGVRMAYIVPKVMARPYGANPGAIMRLGPFAELKGVPTGTDVGDALGATDQGALDRELERRRADKARRHKEEARAAMIREQRRRDADDGLSRRAEASASGRMCFFGERSPDYVKITKLAHLGDHPEYFERFRDVRFDVTEKEDGLNMTLYCNRLQDPRRPIHVCIGGQEVRWSDGSYFWRLALSLGIAERLLDGGRNVVLEGVVVGPGFRNGYEDGYRRDDFKVFDVFDLDDDRALDADERRAFCREHAVATVRDVLTDCALFAEHATAESLSALASGMTMRSTPRHGVVARSRDPSAPLWFDVANPRYADFLRDCAG